jgi:hypothetical protein
VGKSIVLMLVLAAACGSSERAALEGPPSPIDAPPPPPPPPPPPVDAAPSGVASCLFDVDPLTVAPLRERLAYLASPELEGRGAGTAGEELARQHVAARFRCLGLIPAGDGGDYLQMFETDDGESGNVIGYLPGIDPELRDEIIVVGAHIDHVGTAGDKTWYGANDNASGTTAMLAVAQWFAQSTLRVAGGYGRTIAFVGFGAEETGLNGSRYFVDHPPAALPLERVVYMVNLDMVGTYNAKKRMAAYGSFPGTYGRFLLDQILPSYDDLTVKLGGSSTRSDHAPFCAAGVPYLFFFTADPPCYHRTCDTADRIDYAHLARIARLTTTVVSHLATEPDLLAQRDRIGCGKKK